MTKTFLVEVSHERITPVTVEAESYLVAIEYVMARRGEPGDEVNGATKILSIRCVSEECE